MINYYEILGLNSGAGSMEIKIAFRRLAKLYHPDKNPHGRDHFNKVLRAYEILSDPVQKSNYDYRLKYHAAPSVSNDTRTTGTKTWRFDEKELKRRQYYNDYIKKQTEAANVDTAADQKKTYNEYKYIFFATPLAVALFLLIMNLATTHKPLPEAKYSRAQHTAEANEALPGTGMPVYTYIFGNGKKDSLSGFKMTTRNNTGSDVIVCLFSGRTFLRSFFIKENERYVAGGVPPGLIDLKYISGHSFEPEKTIENTNIQGLFAEDLRFFKCTGRLRLKEDEDLLLTADHTNFKEVSSELFFNSQ